MSLPSTLAELLREPSPAGLRQLRGELYSAGIEADAPIRPVLDQAHRFFNQLLATSSAKEYSHFASLLDVGALGIVVLQNIADAQETEGFWGKLVSGALSEGLMIVASRQYVKAFEEELRAVYQEAAWDLFHDLWQLSTVMQPTLPAGERRHLLDHLLAPLYNPETPGTAKALLIGRLYQILLLVYLQPYLAA